MKTKQHISLTVPEEFVGQRLDRFLVTAPGVVSRSFAQGLIEKNQVTVDGKKVRGSLELKLNQTVDIFLPEPESTELIPYDFPLDILFEDKDLIVLNKPSGLVIHPAAGHQQDTLVNALLHHTRDLSMKNEQRPGIVHRIDKETSGLLVVAKNDLAHERLALQFKKKTSHRVYYAVASGALMKNSGRIQSYLARHPNDRKRYASVRKNNQVITTYDEGFQDGKWAITHFQKIAQTGGMTYIKLQLETGRTHQIRVHLSEMRLPLVGDTLYGYSSQKAKNEKLDRFYLHAAELGFTHPTTQEKMLFKVGWPEKDLMQLRRWGFTDEQLKV